MKSERRHELRENDLAHTLTVTRDFFEQYSKQITIGAVAILAVFAITSFVLRSRAEAHHDVWRQKNLLSFETPQEGAKGVDRLLELVDETSDRRFVLDGLMEAGRQSLKLAREAPFPPDREMNKRARRSFEELLKRFPRDPLPVGVALGGLATVEENEFLWDYDLSHKEKARGYLSRLSADSMFQSLPFQRTALDRLKSLDSVFQVTVFMPPPPPPPPVVETPTDAAAAPVPVEPVDHP